MSWTAPKLSAGNVVSKGICPTHVLPNQLLLLKEHIPSRRRPTIITFFLGSKGVVPTSLESAIFDS